MDADTLNRLLSESKASADVRHAFGESRQIGEKTIIPVAKVTWGGGSGFGTSMPGQASVPGEKAEGESKSAAPAGAGGGQGSGFRVRPIAVLEVTPTETKMRPVVDSTTIALAGIILGGWNVFWITWALKSIFRK